MTYLKEHFRYIDKSKRILEAGSIDLWEAALDSSQSKAFDYIVASNVIEYVPDVLKFFADVQNILAKNGQLHLTISNKMQTTDRYRQPVTFAEIYDIHKKGVRNNPVRVLDYLLNTNQNGTLPFNTEAFDLGLQIYERLQKSDEQAGVSLNVFTPESFLLILYSALKLRIFPFKVLFFSAPPESPDFDVVLETNEANADAEHILKALKDISAPPLPPQNTPDKIFGRVSYSQDAEDLLLKGFLWHTGKHTDYKGFYVDVGAHHPFRYSNTAIFYEIGWRGINIEPDPSLIKNFQIMRNRDINLNFGIANEEKDSNFFIFDDTAFNTFDEEIAKKVNEQSCRMREQRIIPLRKLSTLLEQYLPKGQEIDFFSIDVEGLDLEVLKSNDWKKFSPQFILVETHLDETDEISKFLKQLNYRFKGCSPLTSIWQRNN